MNYWEKFKEGAGEAATVTKNSAKKLKVGYWISVLLYDIVDVIASNWNLDVKK